MLRHWFRSPAASCLTALLGACSVATQPNAPDASAPQGTGATGAACTQDGDCAGGVCILALPGGYCAEICSADADCPTNTLCLQANTSQFACLLTCQSNNDCRSGYVCGFIDPVCEPACIRDADCLGENQVCNTSTGQCHTTCYLRCSCPSGQACVECPAGQTCASLNNSNIGDCDVSPDAGSDATCMTDCDCPFGQVCGAQSLCVTE